MPGLPASLGPETGRDAGEQGLGVVGAPPADPQSEGADQAISRLGHRRVVEGHAEPRLGAALGADGSLPGMADPESAARLLVQHMLAIAGDRPGLHVFVTHDTLVTAIAARLLGVPLGTSAWPWSLEGAFSWREPGGFSTACRDNRALTPSPAT